MWFLHVILAIHLISETVSFLLGFLVHTAIEGKTMVEGNINIIGTAITILHKAVVGNSKILAAESTLK